MRRVVLLGCLFVAFGIVGFGSVPVSRADDPAWEAKVDKLFEKWISIDSPGAAVAIVKDGMVIYRKGFGSANLEYNVPITPSTVFHVASVSKQFTAMAITMLEAAGKVSADDDIRKYLPELADFGRTITIRHLLHHTSGLRDQWDLLILSGWRLDDVITQAHIMDRLKRQRELNFAPGEQYLYCNSGYTLLAEIVSRVSAQPFAQWTRENIFMPLGMTSTHFHVDHQEIVRNRAYSYGGDQAKGFAHRVLSYANAGATSLFTSVEDMANWLRNFEEKRVGGAAVLDRMLTKGVLADGTKIPYARGIQVDEYRGLGFVGHGGGDAGFRSDVIYFPGQRFGVAVLSNLASFSPGTLSRQIADILLAPSFKQPEPASPGPKAPPSGPPSKDVRLTAGSLEAFAGTYWFEAAQHARRIVLDKDKLVYVRPDEYNSELAPVSETVFRMKDTPNEVLVRFGDRKGKRHDTLTVTVDGQPPAVGKWMEPYSPTEDMLREYAGSYYSGELDARYDLTVRSGALHVQFGRHEEFPLAPHKADFFSTGNFAKFRFTRDGRGAVDGFMVSTGRVWNLKFAKLRP